MARKNPFVALGRPRNAARAPAGAGASRNMSISAPLGAGASPMAALSAPVPGAAFNRGGAVFGHKTMPCHFDDAGHVSKAEFTKKLCRGGNVK